MELILKSKDIKNKEFIPVQYTGYGEDMSPSFSIEGIDENTKSMVLTLDDADHPRIKNFNHYIAFNIEVVNEIPSHLPKGGKIASPIKLTQGRAYGFHKYSGPKTPKGETHTYVFTLFTLDTVLVASSWANKKKIFKLMEGHVLQKATLEVLFTPPIK